MNKLKILQDLNRIETRLNKQDEPHIIVNLDKFEFTVLNEKRTRYVPNPTPLKFHQDNSFVRFLMGPYGSSKSSTLCADVLFQSIIMPPCKDGIRHSRCTFIRNTHDDLWKTIYQTWLEWFGQLGEFKPLKKPLECKQIFRVQGIKEKIDLELWFIPLDRPGDIDRFKSLQTTIAVLNELSELPPETLTHLKTRIGRFPSKKDIDYKYRSGIIADSNPPDIDSWIYYSFEIDKPDNYSIFKQPPAVIEVEENKYIMNPHCENIQHHNNPNYYLDFIKGETKEFIKVYAMGQYGSVFTGKKVFENYNDDIHSKDNLESVKDSQLIVAWDFGLTPACLISELTKIGQLLVLKEFCTDRLCVRELVNEYVYYYLNLKYKDYPYISIGDPSDRKNDATGKSCIQVLNESGIITSKAITNELVARIDAVKQFLNKLVDGKPAILISKENCPTLRKGFLGKYNYKRLPIVGQNRFKDVPDKTHPYSDIMDCLQYTCLELCYKNRTSQTISKDFFKPVPMWC